MLKSGGAARAAARGALALAPPWRVRVPALPHLASGRIFAPVIRANDGALTLAHSVAWPDAGPRPPRRVHVLPRPARIRVTTTVTPVSSPPTPVPAVAPVVRLRLLGETAIDVGGVPVGPESQVVFALLLVLSLERGRRLARTALHRLLWPAADDDSGRHNLRQVLYKLRQLGVPVDATPSSVMLPAAGVTGEIVALAGGDHSIGARLAGGRRLGDFLPGYAPSFSAPFADWLDEQRALVQSQLRRGLLAALAAARGIGQWREVEAIAREVLRVDPLNEEATLTLAEATALAGAKAQALGIIDRYLDEVGGRPTDMRLPATILRRRIAERFPAHRYVSAADACFVGRAAEMATLLGIWQRARERRGSALLLWGEPGIGKTRLAHELGRVATLQGAQVQRVTSRSWDVQRPLGAIVDLVPGLRELPGAAGVDPRCNEHLDRLTKHDPERPLTDLPDPATLHRQVRQAVFDLVDALLAEAPLVLVFEDVQWLDASSWEVLAELLRLSRTRRLLLVLTSRVSQPAQMPESADWEALRRVRLDGIDAAATNELLDAMTREAGKYIDPDYREWCVPLANGNPLHAQEIALQWLEKGSVREAPGSLKAMIESRIIGLSSIALRALQACTLAGANATPRVVAASLAASVVHILSALDDLERFGFVHLQNDVLVVRHSLIAEQALSLLQVGPKAVLHDRLASALSSDARSSERPALLWDCYQHWRQAGLEGPATKALIAFSDHLLSTGRALQAQHLLRSTLTTCVGDQYRRMLRDRLLATSVHLGRWQDIENLRTDDSTAHLVCSDSLINHFEARWRRNGDVSQLQLEALRLARGQAFTAKTRIRAASWALIFADNAGDHECSSKLDPVILPLIDRAGVTACYSAHYRVLSANQQADADSLLNAAQDLQYAALKEASSAEQLRYLRHAAQGLALAGQLEQACDVLHSAIQVAAALRAPHPMATCAEILADLHLFKHDLEGVRKWCSEAARSFAETDDQNAAQATAYLLFQADVAEGKVEAALGRLHVLGHPEVSDSNLARNLAQRAARLRAAALLGELPRSIENELDLCEAAIRMRRTVISSEFLAAAVVHAHIVSGHPTRAAQVLDSYVNGSRFRRGPLHVDLENARRSLEAMNR